MIREDFSVAWMLGYLYATSGGKDPTDRELKDYKWFVETPDVNSLLKIPEDDLFVNNYRTHFQGLNERGIAAYVRHIPTGLATTVDRHPTYPENLKEAIEEVEAMVYAERFVD